MRLHARSYSRDKRTGERQTPAAQRRREKGRRSVNLLSWEPTLPSVLRSPTLSRRARTQQSRRNVERGTRNVQRNVHESRHSTYCGQSRGMPASSSLRTVLQKQRRSWRVACSTVHLTTIDEVNRDNVLSCFFQELASPRRACDRWSGSQRDAELFAQSL